MYMHMFRFTVKNSFFYRAEEVYIYNTLKGFQQEYEFIIIFCLFKHVLTPLTLLLSDFECLIVPQFISLHITDLHVSVLYQKKLLPCSVHTLDAVCIFEN